MSTFVTIRDPEKRCTGADEERKGRTHPCGLPKWHNGNCACFCGRAWPKNAPTEKRNPA